MIPSDVTITHLSRLERRSVASARIARWYVDEWGGPDEDSDAAVARAVAEIGEGEPGGGRLPSTWVAEVAGRLVGAAQLKRREVPALDTFEYWLGGVHVDATLRRRGVACRLIERCVASPVTHRASNSCRAAGGPTPDQRRPPRLAPRDLHGRCRLIFDADGKLESTVVDQSGAYGGGYQAYPYHGYDCGFDPGVDYYDLPYSDTEIGELEPFDHEDVYGARRVRVALPGTRAVEAVRVFREGALRSITHHREAE